MSDVFGPGYAAAYDLLYSDKDYAAECDVIERAFAEFPAAPVRRVLDLGCGTGGHAIPLAGRGYDVVGVDRSPAMLDAARAKAAAGKIDGITFVTSDIATVPHVAACDAALMMFNVLGYQTSPADLAAALGSVRRNLRAGGLFVFDVWHAPAVEHDGPAQRWRVIEQNGERVIRLSFGDLDRVAEICSVTMRTMRIIGDRVADETVEEHQIRYFRRETLARFLEGARMELLRFGRFPEYWREPDVQYWSVLGVARTVG